MAHRRATLAVVVFVALLSLYLFVAYRYSGLLIDWRHTVDPERMRFRPHTEPLLTEDEVAGVWNAVRELRPQWERRNRAMSTLGAASYLDAGRIYAEKAARWNPVLKDRFGWLHERVRRHFERTLNKPVRWKENAALPGFHVFSGEAMRWPVAKVHVDRQQMRLPWPEGTDKRAATISWTLPIALPKSGGAGLYVFDVKAGEINCRVPWWPLLMRSRPKTKILYREGEIVWHDGNQYHMIAHMPDLREGEERITMQGHGVLLPEGVYEFYW